MNHPVNLDEDTTDEERYVCQIKSSNYTIHSDNDISVAVQNTGDMP